MKPGDKVLATDPEAGETRVEPIAAEITGDGVKHLVKVIIDADGEAGSKTAEVTATDGHPFWWRGTTWYSSVHDEDYPAGVP